jgi:hypothetical protein
MFRFCSAGVGNAIAVAAQLHARVKFHLSGHIGRPSTRASGPRCPAAGI